MFYLRKDDLMVHILREGYSLYNSNDINYIYFAIITMLHNRFMPY
jgi:hypothetical protein